MAQKKNTLQFIAKSIETHGERYDYSKAKYVSAHQKVTIVCPVHGEFEQRAQDHVMGKGCAFCSSRKKKTSKSFISQAKKIHGDKYKYSNVEYINARTKVTITCPAHGDFEQMPSSHLSGAGCATCAAKNRRLVKLI